MNIGGQKIQTFEQRVASYLHSTFERRWKMGIYNQIDEIVEIIRVNPDFAALFMTNPEEVVEIFLGTDLTDDAKKTVIATIQTRMYDKNLFESFVKNAPEIKEKDK